MLRPALPRCSLSLLGLFGLLVSLACLAAIVFFAGTATLAFMAAPQSVGNIYYALALAWVVGSLFGYVPLLLALISLPAKKAILPLVHVAIVVAGGYAALFLYRSDPVRPWIILWFVISVITLLLIAIRGVGKRAQQIRTIDKTKL